MNFRPFTLSLLGLFISFGSLAQVDVDIALTEYATGLDKPVDIAHAGDERLFIVEKDGVIRILDADGAVSSTSFLDIQDLTSTGGFNSEQGLLGIAFHPAYADNGYFYVNYTRPNGDTRISRFTVSSDPDVADEASRLDIMTIDQPFGNHNGGCLRFGPDGYLYIGMGDGGSGEDPQNNGQSMDKLLGKMLRIDINVSALYEVPASNPFVGTGSDTLPEIWASGLRNPWRFAFDSETGDMWIADVGQYSWEEVDFQPASSTGGENYGWRCYEGNHVGFGGGCPPMSEFEPAVAEYSHSGGNCSISGGDVYRGTGSPSLLGKYIYADYCSGKFWSTELNDADEFVTFEVSGTLGLGYTVIASAADGRMFAANQNNGKIYEITDQCANLTTSFTTEGNTLTAESGQSYQWYLNGELIENATEQTYVIIESGAYSVQLINSDGCTVESEEQSVILSSVDEFENVHGVSIANNPVDDVLEIRFNSLTTRGLLLEVYSISGKLVRSSLVGEGQTIWTEDISSLAKGRYTMSLSNADGRSVISFVIAR
jgi:glucose/arabinose dehydrogenase